MARTQQTVTLKQIAEKAGVTPQVVSAALADRHGPSDTRFSKATQQHVRDIARKLNYRPHSAARAIRSKRFQTVGLVLARSYSTPQATLHPLNTSMIDGINDVLLDEDYCLSLLRISRLPMADSGNWPRMLAESRVDGLVVSGNAPPELCDYVKQSQLPAVWVNVNYHSPNDCIYYDEVATGRMITRYLADHGHKHIALLKSPSEIHYSASERHQGYLEELASLGLQSYPGHEKLIGDDEFLTHLASLMNRNDPPTAMFPLHGTRPLLLALHQLGYHVPQDVSAIVWAEATEPNYGLKSPTAAVGDSYALGRTAATMILEKIAGDGKPVASKVLNFQICPGATVTHPKSGTHP